MTNRPQRRSRRRPLARRRAARPRRQAPNLLEVRVERRASVVLLHLAGEFDVGGVEQVETALAGAVDARTDHVVFDLHGLRFLDLCAMETLVRADTHAFAVHVVPPPADVARIFAMTAAGRGLEMLDDVPD
jgi:anti-anti-sigma factor